MLSKDKTQRKSFSKQSLVPKKHTAATQTPKSPLQRPQGVILGSHAGSLYSFLRDPITPREDSSEQRHQVLRRIDQHHPFSSSLFWPEINFKGLRGDHSLHNVTQQFACRLFYPMPQMFNHKVLSTSPHVPKYPGSFPSFFLQIFHRSGPIILQYFNSSLYHPSHPQND